MNICIKVFYRPLFSFLLTRYLGVKSMGYMVAWTVKNLRATQEDLGSTPGSGICPGEGNGSPLWCSCLGNPMDRGT